MKAPFEGGVTGYLGDGVGAADTCKNLEMGVISVNSGRNKLATIDDVARLAAVSRYTVSRAYTPGGSVAPATRRRIEAAAAALGYVPNLIARSLSTQRSRLIAVAVARLENSFHAEMMQTLSAGLAEHGYQVLIFVVDSRTDSDPPMEAILRYRADALILLSVRLSSRFTEQCRAANVPVLLLNRYVDDPDIPAIVGDNAVGARAIADFLLDGGHERFAFIAGHEDSSTSRDRESSFTRRLFERGARPPSRAVGNFVPEQAAEAARGLLSRGKRPDAIFCANDHMAFAVMDVARREFGLDIGRQLSVVGFDGSLPAQWAGPGLTTYTQPAQDMARLAVRRVTEWLSGGAITPHREVVGGELVIRASARCPAS